MDCLIPIFLAAGLVAGCWWCWHWRFQIQRRRLEALLEWLASGGKPERIDFLNRGSLASLGVPVERLAAELERLRMEAQRESFNLRTILESMEEGVMVVDSSHVLRLVNPSFVRLFQLKRDPVGLSILHTLRETTVEEMVTDALKTGEAQNREFTINGSKMQRHLTVHAVPVRDTTGRPSVLTIFRDISRLKQLEEVRREFVANVSHELRTPLSIFHGYVEHLLDTPDLPGEDLAGVLQILKRHSLRLNALLEDLLILARLEARTEKFDVKPIPLRQFVSTVAHDWAGKLASKGVQLDVDLSPDLSPLPADSLRLEQVLSNLLENALKYTPEGGRIAVRAQEEAEAIVIRVEDTGAGILPSDLPHIFERFYRADKARTRERGGTGLGLSIVKHIVQTHGGTVHAESVFGQGTSIILRMPKRYTEPRVAQHDELAA